MYGHGVFSQFKPEHSKEWEQKTDTLRRQHPEQSKRGSNGSTSKTLEQMRMLLRTTQDLEPTPGFQLRTSLDSFDDMPAAAPHQVHHYHFGWQPPQKEKEVGTDAARQGLQYGTALTFARDVHNKSSKIIARQKLG